MIGAPNWRHLLTQLASTDFLQVCALLASRENRLAKETEGKRDRELPQISCKREAILGLPLASYTRHADEVEQGFPLVQGTQG